MVEIRFHGRGGQGTVVATILLAKAFFQAGYYVQSFPLFGVERRGAPVEAYLRLDCTKILVRTNVYNPDHVVVLDQTLLAGADVTRGLKQGGWILVNAPQPLPELASFTEFRLAFVDATWIALHHCLGTRTHPIVNTAITGALARILGMPPLTAIAEAIREEVPGMPEENIKAAEDAYREVTLLGPMGGDGPPVSHDGPRAVHSGPMGFSNTLLTERPFPARGRFPEMSTDSRRLTPLLIPCSHLTTEGNKTGAWRFLRPRYDEKTAPCSAACPAGEDIGRIEMLAAEGLFREGWETVLRENPFPGICGRVCYHPCESVCNRGEFDEPVAVHILERFLADTASRSELKPAVERLAARRQKIAVIGSGPSGLAAAYFLTRLGYRADVFEAMPEPGGVLRWGIPPYRLPLPVLNREIALIQELGVRIRCGKHVSPQSLRAAGRGYDAVVLGCGHSRSLRPKVPGEDLEGVEHGLRFLKRIRQGEVPSLRGTIAVIGGGNTAMDVARSAARLGARSVVVYRRRRQDMPAVADEVEMALAEGVELQELETPVAINTRNGHLVITLQGMRVAGEGHRGRARVEPDPRKTREMEVQRLFLAVGATTAEEWEDPPGKSQGALLLANSVLLQEPGRPLLIFGGDLVSETKSVVHAVASGKEAAIALDVFFRDGLESVQPKLRTCLVGEGPSLSMEAYLGGPRSRRNRRIVRYDDLNTDHFRFAARIIQPRLLREERLRSFAEIDLKIGANLATREAERCFNCGLCNQCDNCQLFCPDLAVICDRKAGSRSINYDYCKGCGLCVVECPRNAMILEEEALCGRS